MGEVLRLALVGVMAGCGFQSGHALVVGGDAPESDAPADAVADVAIDAPPPVIGLRQMGNDDNGSNVTQLQIPLTMPQLAGDVNVIMVGWYPSTSVPAVTDTAGNLYTLALGPTNVGGEYLSVYYKCGIVAAATNTVTVTFTPAAQPDVHVLEYTGIQASNCLDTANTASAASGTAMDVMVDTTFPRDLLVSTTFQLNQATAGDAMYMSRGINSFGDLVQDRTTSVTGTYHAHATQNTSGDWIIDLLAFKGY